MQIRKIFRYPITLIAILSSIVTFDYPYIYARPACVKSASLVPRQAIDQSSADSAWAILSKIEMSEEKDLLQGILLESRRRLWYWEAGKQFWQRFPTDKRRYKWLQNVVSNPPKFWVNDEKACKESFEKSFYSAPINKGLTDLWKAQVKEYRSIYFMDLTTSKTDKFQFICSELYSELILSKNSEYRESKKKFLSNISNYANELLLNLDPDSEIGRLKRCMEILFLGTTNFEVNYEDLRKILAYFSNTKNKKIEAWVSQKNNLLNLEYSPLKENFPLPDGNFFNIERLRGKVVLIDIWNVNCSSCIERMPALKKMYTKYKGDGFEVLSISTDSRDKSWRLDSIVRGKIGAMWPMILIGGANYQEFVSPSAYWKTLWTTYGFFSVPQMILLNREGKMAVLNGPLQSGNFESILKKLLIQELN